MLTASIFPCSCSKRTTAMSSSAPGSGEYSRVAPTILGGRLSSASADSSSHSLGMPEESRRSRGEDEDVMDDVLLHHRGDSAIPTSSTHSMGESVGKSSTGILRGSGGGGGGGSGSTILRVEGNSGDLNAMLTTVFEHAARLSRRAADAFLFMWMVPLLELGNERPLRQGDLYELDPSDRAVSVFALFKRCWREQEKAGDAASLAMAFFHAFGLPFVGAGALKLVHDMCLFVGPQLLNRLILFLSDPHEPQSTGYKYVALLFLANVVMSLCLRQYFWWCYRVGMRLRSAVVTSVYHKTLVVNAGVMARRSMGETTNLMSIDATRLQELTPYLHAIWYSFVQIGIALYFLWEQVGPSCLGGIAVILLAIPMTGRISKYLKSVQKDMSKVRDERVKLGNEVLAGMKVIKLQAWEQEFQTRLNEVRDRELALFRKYILAQSLSGAVYTAVPILVGIFTFILYVALGNELHVSTALTSLALFEILRFPLYMLPNVLNSVVEAKVSVDRVQSYLLEPEKAGVPEAPLRRPGVRLAKATVVYEGVGRSVDREEYDREFVQKRRGRPLAPYLAESDDEFAGMPEPNPIMRWLDTARAYLAGLPVIGPYLPFVNSAVPTGSGTSAKVYLSESEYDTVLLRAELEEANGVIDSLIRQSMSPHGGVQLAAATGAAGGVSSFLSTDSTEAGGVLKSRSHSLDVYDSAEAGAGISRTGSSSSNNGTPDAATRATSERILALSRVDLAARSGELVAVVGLVGSGKSSLITALLGDLRLCSGGVSVKGRVAFAGQRPFIQNATLKDNVLFGLPFDEAKYQRTLQMCALLPDLAVLPSGDQTEIGERGINLSGGQKARVSLARAVYSDADVYLLDDPLAAVDAHVGKHLFEECIMVLKRQGKCVVLVTNALHFLRHASYIVVLKDARIAEAGTYDQLLEHTTKSPATAGSKSQSGSRNSSDTAAVYTPGIVQGLFADMLAAFKETQRASGGGGEGAGASDMDDDAFAEEEEALHIDEPAAAVNTADKSQPGQAEKASLSSSSESPGRLGGSASVPTPTSGRLMTEEDREIGSVDMQVYRKWAVAAGGISVAVIVLGLYVASEIVSVSASWWLSFWSENREDNTPWFYLGIYMLINAVVIALTLGKELFVRITGWNASQSLFRELLAAVMHAPMSFFDTTPMGRVINRFSKDVYTVDEQLPQTMRGYLGTVLRVLSVVIYICIVTPLFIIGLIPVAGFYYFAQRYFISTSRELTRLDSGSRSPIFALFSETIDGLSCIRAFKTEAISARRCNQLLDNNQKAYFLNFSANCWLAIRLEFAGTLIVTFAALFAVISRGEPDLSAAATEAGPDDSSRERFAGLAGLAISLALSVTQSLNWSVRMASDLESQMVAVERIKTYATMTQEAAHFTDHDPPSSWPQSGAIELRGVSLRYRPETPLVLQGVDLSIPARCKVGIVGRTGAGKSSLLAALMRIVELETGRVSIDGVDVSSIGLHALRSRIAVIPQDPVLFSGTIRSNLDPFKKFTDGQIWESLRRTCMDRSVRGLEDRVEDGGSNLSVGQRQLLCIARALLSQARIIIMDEATAAVDVETDAAIQRTVRSEFANATLLTVAHRLNTIMDSDLVVVMDKGRVVECDAPSVLLARGPGGSMFRDLADRWEQEHKAQEASH